MRKIRKDTVVSILFDDHVQGHDEPVRCIVFGRVHKCTPQAIVVKSWDYATPTDGLDYNIEHFTIMQSAIVKLTRHDGPHYPTDNKTKTDGKNKRHAGRAGSRHR